MPARKPLDLSSLDDKLLDGLKFCLKVYDLFDQVRAEPRWPWENQAAEKQTGKAAAGRIASACSVHSGAIPHRQ
jgi:hypothetical protein